MKTIIIGLFLMLFVIGCKQDGDIIFAVNDCVCGEKQFLCPAKALNNTDNLEHWEEFCFCVDACMKDNRGAVINGDMVQEELELNCSDYCASYADETSGYAN